ncbi:DUF4231 domain-containing protein [Megasphaera hexanoica]|uniref:DUF4231 domain-containing protein n=1 Tax=Megasphaera hexanoica TaxID=1675036 RepID=A0A848BUD7_9FIRM|nr:DUF4231 domain-containing protein [Megasphaera hexanoica]NME28865.1 DUF4231 domain-containing protein [Megasphaera hexanoica]
MDSNTNERILMTPQEYIEKRLDNQQIWFSNKSQTCQSRYKWLRRFEYIACIIIPIIQFNPLWPDIYNKLLGLLLGGIAAYVHFEYQLDMYFELWIKYRIASEKLKKEKALYLCKAGPYKEKTNEQCFTSLVTNVEQIITEANQQWGILSQNIPDAGKDTYSSTGS